jgi:MYXO-CTERM domain-containing protein
VDKAGTGYTLQASSGVLSGTSASFNVAMGPAARLFFRTPPANTAANVGLGSIQVEIQDAAGNVSTGSTAQVSLSLGGPSGGTLGGTTTVAAVSGVATFSDLFIRQAASGYTLTASSAALQNVTSGPFNITAGPPTALAFTVQPGSGVVSTNLSPAPRVAVQDAYGNLVTGATHSITLALATNPQGATLTGTTVVASINGVATFGAVAVNRAGTSFKLIATASSLTSATSTAFDIRADGAARLAFKLGPTSTVAGANLAAVSVELQDTNGNPVNGTDSITLTLQGSQGGTLSGTTTVSASGGVATFSNLSIARAGTGYRLAAHANGLVDALSATFDITPGPAAKLVFAVQPSLVQAGSPFNPAIRVGLEDAFGNPSIGATDAVTLALGNNPRSGTLSGTKTVNAVNGVATFSDLTIDRAAQGYTLQANSGSLPPAMSSAFTVTPGPAARFMLTLPASVTAGAETTLFATAHDAFGNVASTYAGPAVVTSSDPTAVFPATVTFAEGVLQSLKVTFKSPGPRTLILTDSANASLSAVAQTQVSSLAQPTVSVTSPAGGAIVSGTVNIIATGVVAAGTTVAQLSILVDGAVIGSGTNEALAASWDSSKVPAGSAHTITALIVDGAGNVATSAPVAVTTKASSDSGCGCGATSGTDASISLGLLLLARYALRRRRQAKAA